MIYNHCQDFLVDIFNMKIENECQEKISKARVFITNGDYDSAASELSLITPDLNCFETVQSIFVEILDRKCAEYLGMAKGAWSSRNISDAAFYISKIPADSNCFEEASRLSVEIASKIDADEKREWDLAYEKYNRNQSLRENRAQHIIDMEVREMKYKENQGFEIEKAKINAAMQIGVAYGKNQPRKVTYNYSNWK